MSSALSFRYLLEGYMPSILLATVAVVLLCIQRLSLKLDPREPPILKPKIPYVGHIFNLMRKHGAFWDDLYKESPMPIATLPMLNGKMYMITSPQLIQSALRSKDLTFNNFVLEFAQRMTGVSDATMAPVRAEGFMNEFVAALHAGFAPEHLHKMNASALNYLAGTLNDLDGIHEVDSLYLWMRDVLTMATSTSLFGSKNPLLKDPSLIDAQWDYEAGLPLLLLNVAPWLVAPKPFKARERMNSVLIPYYTNKYDLLPDVAEITKTRASLLRRHNVSGEDVGKFEIALLHVSTANAIPTAFWHLAYVASNPELVAELREELKAVYTIDQAADGKRTATINITKFESHCPLLLSSYREAMRMSNGQSGARHVTADVNLSDGQRTYLLKEGTAVQMPANISHRSTEIWGADAASFNAKRFLGLATNEKAREMKAGLIPFGGGKHLCPGRNFAQAEILGTLSMLLLGWEVQSKDGGTPEVPEMRSLVFGEAVKKPSAKGVKVGARFVRREEWADVRFKFIC